MALSAGSVFVTLGGNFNSKAFAEFNSATMGAAGKMRAAESAISSSSAKASRSLHSMSQAASTAAKVGIAGLAVGLAESVKTAADFERSMRNVNSIAKLSEPQFKSLSKSVLELSGKTAQAPKTLAEGMYQLVSSGFNAKESLGILKTSAIAAAAGLTNTETATTAVAAALNAYHLPASKAAQISDTLFQTVNRGVITFPQLASTIGMVLPFANSLHIGLNQVGASISTLTKEGIPAAEATTYLKNAMVQFLKPSDALASAIKKTGAESGEALVKSKGFQGALEAVARTTDGTKSALQKLFPDIRASAAVFALTGTNAKTAEGDLRAFGNVSGITAKVFAEQSKSASFQFQQLKANIAAGAVVIGTALLPRLNSAAISLNKFLLNAQKSGQIDHIAQDAAAGFSTLAHVLGDIASTGGEVAGVLLQIGNALHLTNATGIEAVIAGFAGFKIAGIVAPMVMDLAHAVQGLMIAGKAGALTQMFSALMSGGGAIKLAAVATGLLAAGLVVLGSHESEESALAKANADAHKEQAAAIKSVSNAELEAANKGLAAHDANKQVREDQAAINKLRSEGKTHTKEYADLQDRLNDDTLHATVTQKAYNASIEDQIKANKTRIAQASSALSKAVADVAHTNTPTTISTRGGPAKLPFNAQQLADQAHAQANLTQRVKEYEQALARSSVSELSRQRLMAASSQIDDASSQGIGKLIAAMKGLPKETKIGILMTGDQKILSQVGNMISKVKSVPEKKRISAILAGDGSVAEKLEHVKAVIAGVPTHTIAHILATTNGEASVRALRAAINSVQSKTVTVAVNTINTEIQKVIRFGGARAAGRGQIGAETALVGEGAAPEWRINPVSGEMERISHPQIRRLDSGDYIIPTERKYRGRALGLLGAVARDMGLPGYAAGKAPTKWHDLPIPAPYKAPKLPVADLKTLRTKAQSALTKDQKAVERDNVKVRKLEDQESTIEKRAAKTASQKASKKAALAAIHKKLDDAKRTQSEDLHQLPKLDAQFQRADKQWSDAVKFQAQIDEWKTRIDIARNDMSIANRKHDLPGYNEAKGRRGTLLEQVRAMYQAALAAAAPGSEYASGLATDISNTDEDISANAVETPDEPQLTAEEQAFQDTGLTPAEQSWLKHLQGVLSAAKATPDTGDDLAAAKDIQAFLESALNGDNSGRNVNGIMASGDAISDLTDQVQQARQDVLDLAHDDTGMTPEEQTRYKGLLRDEALAALTTDTGDDATAATAVQGFLEGVLAEVQATPGNYQDPTGVITTLAGMIASARSDVQSFLPGGSNSSTGSGPTQDQQAMLDQANARADAAEANYRASSAYIQAIGSPGDIGTGAYGSALQAAGGPNVTVQFQSYVPPTPAQARQLGGHVAAGFSYQNPRSSPRSNTGL